MIKFHQDLVLFVTPRHVVRLVLSKAQAGRAELPNTSTHVCPHAAVWGERNALK